MNLNPCNIHCSRFKGEILKNITGSTGNGPIKTYIHKVGIGSVTVLRYLSDDDTCSPIFRFILGRRSRRLIERWQPIKICKLQIPFILFQFSGLFQLDYRHLQREDHRRGYLITQISERVRRVDCITRTNSTSCMTWSCAVIIGRSVTKSIVSMVMASQWNICTVRWFFFFALWDHYYQEEAVFDTHQIFPRVLRWIFPSAKTCSLPVYARLVYIFQHSHSRSHCSLYLFCLTVRLNGLSISRERDQMIMQMLKHNNISGALYY